MLPRAPYLRLSTRAAWYELTKDLTLQCQRMVLPISSRERRKLPCPVKACTLRLVASAMTSQVPFALKVRILLSELLSTVSTLSLEC
jgi:hypothetical protein